MVRTGALLFVSTLLVYDVFSHQIGCFIDSSKRDLPFQAIKDTSLTPTACIQHCRLYDYFFAAVQNAKNCYCGNTYGRYGEAPQNECSEPCAGDESQACGGYLRNSIYTTGKALPTATTCKNPAGTHEGVAMGSNCFLFFSKEKKWHEAQQACVNQGGHLAMSINRHVQALLEYQLIANGHGDYWIGIHDILQEGTFMFADGKDTVLGRWNNFYDGHPDSTVDKYDCVEMKSSWGYKWNDLSCTSLRKYVCQIPLNVNANSICGDYKEGVNHYGNCYVLVEGTMKFVDASIECAVRKGIPATIDNDEIQHFLRKQVAMTGSEGNWYFGLKYMMETGQYEFMDGDKIGAYHKYYDGGQNGEECTVLSRTRNFLWEQVRCSSSQNVICQIDPNIPPSYCPRGWLEYENHFYLATDKGVTYDDAKRLCGISKDTYMLKIDDAAENDFVVTKIATNVWLGLNDGDLDGSYTWNDGSHPVYTNWDSSPTEGCMYLHKLAGKWKAGDCTIGWVKAVCEMESPIVFDSI